MQPISSFNDSFGTAILLVGPPGSGKTALGASLLKGTYVFVADLNFSSAIRFLETQNLLDRIVGYDMAAVDSDGKSVPINLRYQRMLNCLQEAIAKLEVKAIFLDSASFIEDIIKARITGATNEATIKMKGHENWGDLLLTWKSIVQQLRTSGKVLIMSAHEEREKDEADGIFKYGVMVDGKIKNRFGGLFSDVWRCEVVENLGKHTWRVRTLGNASHELKNNFGFPPIMDPKEIRSTLDKHFA